MEPQLQHTHGHHYDDTDTLNATAHHTGYDEDEHHGEKKSVIKKVKEKAKKLKNTITKHGHGHGGDDHHHHHHDEEDDDDDDEEMEEDPEVHGAPMYDSARVGLARGNLERPSVMAEDRYGRSDVAEPEARHGAPPPVSTGPYGTNLSEPSGLGHPQPYGQEVNPKQSRGKIGQPTGMEEDPFAPMVSRTHQEELRGSIGKSTTGMVKDPNGPKDPSWVGSDPSNNETKVSDPTHTGGKEAELSQIQHSFDKMGIHDSEPKRFDSNHPENLPRETLTGNPSSRSSSYVEKISSSASAIADKAADVIASKLGYNQVPSSESHETFTKPVSATDYAHKITDKVTETLAPVYEKVVDAGSSVISKVQGSVSGQPPVEKGKEGGDKGVSVKEYLVEKLRPGDDDKALSEVITHAFHRGNHEETEKKSGEDRPPVGRVTESEEVRRRLESDHREEDSRNVVAERGVADRLKDAVGSWFGGKGNAPEGTVGTSYVTDEGLSTSPSPSPSPTENRNGGSGREQ